MSSHELDLTAIDTCDIVSFLENDVFVQLVELICSCAVDGFGTVFTVFKVEWVV